MPEEKKENSFVKDKDSSIMKESSIKDAKVELNNSKLSNNLNQSQNEMSNAMIKDSSQLLDGVQHSQIIEEENKEKLNTSKAESVKREEN